MGLFLLCTFLMIILPIPSGSISIWWPSPHCANPAGERGADPHRFFHLSAGHGGYRAAGGMLADRHGRRPVVLGAPSSSWSPPWWRRRRPASPSFIWGVSGRGGRWSALHHDLHRAAGCAEPGAPRDGLSLINGVICVIPVLAPVLGYLILSHFEWRGIFVGMALVAAISALVNLRLLKETRPARQPAGYRRWPCWARPPSCSAPC